MDKKLLNSSINVRINSEDRESFMVRCLECSISSNDALREMVLAFNDNKLKIKSDKLTQLKGIYDGK